MNFLIIANLHSPLLAQWTQQGNKLVGNGFIRNTNGQVYQGHSVAISADGNTILMGGIYDNGGQGASWVFTRNGSTWTQEGNKLVGTGANRDKKAYQGHAVALSADGNTALVSGPDDNYDEGAVWVFTRTSSSWTQQGEKLVGTGGKGGTHQGQSLALSADGNTALVGGFLDDSRKGAAWVFTRSDTTWTQQGNKLVGTSSVGESKQGTSVALSADGNIALVGEEGDNSHQGAAWIYTRSESTWTQYGKKIVGIGNIGEAFQGKSIALSNDGKTAVVGGFNDNSTQGAVWIFSIEKPTSKNK